MTSRARANLIGGAAVALALVGGFAAGAWRYGAFEGFAPPQSAPSSGTSVVARSAPSSERADGPPQRPAPVPASLDSAMVFGGLTRFPSAAGGLVFIPRPQGETGRAATAQDAWRQGEPPPTQAPAAEPSPPAVDMARALAAPAPLPPARPPFRDEADGAGAPLPPPRPTQLAALGLPPVQPDSPLLAPPALPPPAPPAAPDPAPPRPASGPFTKGSAAFVRIFKKEGQLELWLKRDERYALYKTFPICKWSGRLGPKLREGDHQSPEGFYSVTARQLNPNSAYHLAFNIGFPNAFDRQSKEYRVATLGSHIPRIALEAAHGDFWRKYVGLHGAVIGIDRFGESAPAGQLFEEFGFTLDNVLSTAEELLDV